MNDEYRGVKVGIEIELGNAHLTPFAVVVLLLEDLKQKYPEEFARAAKAILEADE